MRYRIALPLAALAAACHGAVEPPAPPDPGVADRARRVAALLDYVAADYPGAVADGKVVSRFEYDEQVVFLNDAVRLARELPPSGDAGLDLGAELAAVRELVDAVVPGDRVATAARATRRRLLAAYGVVLAPAAPPSFARARQLFGENCTPCHGVTGAGDGHRAHDLKPRPRSFHDDAVMRELTPARVFNALTDGLERTAMASYGLFSPSDRWSLAFYVFTLRHDQGAVARGERAHDAAARALPATATRLASASDGELLAALAEAGVTGDAARDALAYLRGAASFRAVGAPLDTARRHMGSALAAYRNGNTEGARRELNAAYLDGFEPHEGALHTMAPALVSKIEAALLGLRDAIEADEDVADVEHTALYLGALFDLAEERLRGTDGRVVFWSSFVIIVREGLEGALLVLLLLAWARQSGAAERERRAVHAGWMAAMVLGVLTWLAASSLISALGGAHRELIEGVIALLAAAVLLVASHFAIARLDAKRRVAALRAKLDAAASLPRRRWLLASLAFVAVYREAFEVVLFLQALMLDGAHNAAAIVGGLVCATLLLVGLVAAMSRLGRRLAPGPLLTAAGVLLCTLAVVLTGKGVRALQEAALIGIEPLDMVRIDWLGLYPTQQTIAAQLCALAAFAALTVLAAVHNRRGASSDAAAGAT